MKIIKIADRTIKQTSAGKDFVLSFREKIEVAKLLDKLNVSVIELDGIRQEKTDTLLIKSIVTAVKQSLIAVPVKLDTDPMITANALKEAKRYRLQVEAPVSSVRMEYINHKKPAALLESVIKTIEACRKYTDDVEFIAQDATRADAAFLYTIIASAIKAGASTITVCDDAASKLPEEFSGFTDNLFRQVPELREVSFGACASNGIAMADACLIAAASHGAAELKTSAFPLDTADLRNVAKAIDGRGQTFGAKTEIRLTEINRIMSQMERLCTSDGKKNINISDPEPNEEAVLSEHDELPALKKAVSDLGYDLSEEDLSKVYEEFKRIAGKKGSVSAKEIDAIVASSALQVPAAYSLDNYIANTGNAITSTVQIKLLFKGEKTEGISMGDGPIDAAFKAIEQLTGRHFELDDFQIRAVTEGNEAAGEALIKVRNEGKLYSGRGISTDIIGASIRAYLNALNKIVYEEDEA